MTDVEQIDADLSAYVLGDLADEYEPDSEPRTLADIDQADRALWHLRQVETDMARHERLFDVRISQLQERRDEVLGVMRRQHEWWSRRVEMWARAHRDETGGKAKTIKLPSGSISFRQSPDRIDTLAKEPPAELPAEFVRTRREFDKIAIKNATAPGPIAEGVEAPEGMVAHWAVTADGERIPDVVRLVSVVDSIQIKAGA